MRLGCRLQELGQLDGVCSFWEAAQSLVASLAERLGLLAHTPDAVEAAREKQVCGLNTPRLLPILSKTGKRPVPAPCCVTRRRGFAGRCMCSTTIQSCIQLQVNCRGGLSWATPPHDLTMWRTFPPRSFPGVAKYLCL